MTERPHILVVEDEPSIAEVVSLYLRRADYEVTTLRDGQAALAWLAEHTADLVCWTSCCPTWMGLRSRVGCAPVARRRSSCSRRAGEETDRILGLEMGADDYVVKPFSPRELVSRARAVLRRTRGSLSVEEDTALEFEGLSIDPRTRLVKVGGEERTLTAREFDVLVTLARRPRQVFSRDQLLDQVWGVTEYIDPSTVTVHIRRLREKLEANPSHPRFIQTVWGVGYKFEP